MRLAAALILSVFGASAAFAQSSFQWHLFASVREIRVDAPPSWTEHGFGRFDVGANSDHESDLTHVETAQLGADWTPASWLLIHADGIARHEPPGTIGDSWGLVQAYVDVFNDKFRVRIGSFWLPTSRENVDPMWNSRYAITYSALNSWIAQEVRPVGADLQFSPNFYFTVGATAFRDNDTMGTVLAERGWTVGNRLSVYNEEIALPPPDSLTRPFGSDLDGQFGWSARIRGSIPERAMIQIAHVDNRSNLVPGKPPNVPWLTKFNVISGDVGANTPTTFAAEYAKGNTTLAFPGGTFRLDFDSMYVLASRKQGKDRYTTRIERFTTRSHKSFPTDASKEQGKALTVSWLHDINEHWRGGLEYVRVDAERPGIPSDGNSIILELRVSY